MHHQAISVEKRDKEDFGEGKLCSNWSNFVDLKEQCSIIIRITDSCYRKSIELWHGVVSRMPSNIICFARKAFILSLGNNSSLNRWNIRDSAGCDLCHSFIHSFKFI